MAVSPVKGGCVLCFFFVAPVYYLLLFLGKRARDIEHELESVRDCAEEVKLQWRDRVEVFNPTNALCSYCFFLYLVLEQKQEIGKFDFVVDFCVWKAIVFHCEVVHPIRGLWKWRRGLLRIICVLTCTSLDKFLNIFK